MIVRPGSVGEPAVAAVLAGHFELMRASSPEESCHVLPLEDIEREAACLLVAEDAVGILGVGALKDLGAGHGELKSMHTLKAARGRGVARAILHELIAWAQRLEMTRLSLETGTAEMFAPARALYESAGFETCPPFGDYVVDPLSVFMTRAL